MNGTPLSMLNRATAFMYDHAIFRLPLPVGHDKRAKFSNLVEDIIIY